MNFDDIRIILKRHRICDFSLAYFATKFKQMGQTPQDLPTLVKVLLI